MAAAMTPDIKVIVVDSPFASETRGIEEGFTRVTGLPRFPIAPVALTIIEWRLAFCWTTSRRLKRFPLSAPGGG
jgi:hypothetical protein